MVEIGEIALALSLIVSLYTVTVSFMGGRTENELMIRSGQNGYFASTALLTIASASLIYSLISHDYSIKYVYNYTNTDLPIFYTISAFWAGQKGSLLLWGWMLSMFGSIAILQNRNFNKKLMPYIVGILSSTLVLFNLLLVFAAPVFEKMPVLLEDGHGLNPMLQNPGMVFHPPTLYVGFVAFIVPFAFAMSALMNRQMGDVWIRSTRRWTIFAWFFLTMGNLLGANWAYVELGWGGYWAWDPVENASFMPWLVGTAYLHSVMIQEKKDMLKAWGVILIAVTFILTVFGTFITRSGLISSVHAFGRSSVGSYFGFFLFIIIVFSAYLIYTRRDMLKGTNELDSMISRESSFLFNNLLLIGAAFAIFWGTIFPMISEAVRGVKITVGPPFFNQVMVPIGFFLLLLTGICPLIPWHKATVANLQKNFLTPLIMAVVGGGVLLLLGIRNITAWLFFIVAIFVFTTIVMEFIRGARARASFTNTNFVTALFTLVGKNKRRYGGYIIHIGMIMMFVGFTGSAYNNQGEFTVAPGESFTIQDYKLTYIGYTSERPRPTKEEVVATLLVEKNGEKIGYVQPEKNFYSNQEMTNSEVAIHSTIKEDLYVIFASLTEDNRASFKVHINPLVKWLWMGGVVMGIGTIIAMLPDAREKKRFLARYAE